MASAAHGKSKANKSTGSRKKGGKDAAAKPSPRAAATTARRESAAESDRSAPPLAEVDGDVLEFIEAIDRFKRQHNRPFPSWSEVLMVLRELGYRRDRR